MAIIKLVSSVIVAVVSMFFATIVGMDKEQPGSRSLHTTINVDTAHRDGNAGPAREAGESAAGPEEADPDELESMVRDALAAGDTKASADLNGDGRVDAADLLIARGSIDPDAPDGVAAARLSMSLHHAADGHRLNISLADGSVLVQGFSLWLESASSEAVLPLEHVLPSRVSRNHGFVFADRAGAGSFAGSADGRLFLHVAEDAPASDHELDRGRLLWSLRVDPAAIGAHDLRLSPGSRLYDGNGSPLDIDAPAARLINRLPLDVDQSGRIDERDFLSALELVITGDPAADLNRDGRTEIADVLRIREAYGRPVMELELTGSARVSREDADAAMPDTDEPGSPGTDGGEGRAGRPDGGMSAAVIDRPGGAPGGTGGDQDPGVGPAGAGSSQDAGDRRKPPSGRGVPPRVDLIDPPAGSYFVDQIGLDRFTVGFDQNVTIPPGAVRLWGTQNALDIPVTTDYDPVERLLTVEPLQPILADRVTLVVDYTITNAAGLALDGETGNISAPTLPSGDGSQGGQAVFRFTALQGDANRDGLVDDLDQAILVGSLGLGAGDPGFDPSADLNGDGFVNVLDVAILFNGLGAELVQGDGEPLAITSRTPAPDTTYVAAEFTAVTVTFDMPVKQCSLSPTALYAVLPGGGIQPASVVTTTNAGTAALFCFEPPLPTDAAYGLRLSGGLTDLAGEQVGPATDLTWTTFLEAPPPAQLTDRATIVGTISDATTGEPLQDAFVLHYIFDDYFEGQQPLPGIAFTNANGEFELSTVPFEGTETFFVRLLKAGHAENIRIVNALAGRTHRVQDGLLNPVNPRQMVTVAKGATLEDELDGQTIQLDIPPNALKQDSEVSVTILSSPGAIREELPSLVSEGGVFIDIDGVFGDETDLPVTLRLPNTYNLPVGTEIRFGKVSHTDGTWTDLREPFGNPPPPGAPDNFGVGVVVGDGQGGTLIEVLFNNFCTICTGYCLPFLPPSVTDLTGDTGSGRPSDPDSPDNVCGNSVIDTRESFLWEEFALPGFTERGGQWTPKLGYASHAASPAVTMRARINLPNTRPVETSRVDFNIEGSIFSAYFEYVDDGRKPIASFFWDGRDAADQILPTGSYVYEIDAATWNRDVPVAVSSQFGDPPDQEFPGTSFTPSACPGSSGGSPIPRGGSGIAVPPANINPCRDLIVRGDRPPPGRVVIVNKRTSSYGSGWSLTNESRLHLDPDGCVVLVFGNADYRLFVPMADDGNAFQSPKGETSTLVRNADGTYTRSFPDGASEFYDASGRLVRSDDRYGFSTTYSYDAQGRLRTVVSPVGNSITLSYDAATGFLSSISDSAGRVTSIEVDPNGHLVSITDAEGATRQFSYDDEGRMTGQVGSRGERTEYIYENTRVARVLSYDTDGSTLLREREFVPQILATEVAFNAAVDDQGRAIPLPVEADPKDVYIDGRGARTERRRDSLNRLASITDALGRTVGFAYNTQNRWSRITRPDESFTEYEYTTAGDISLIVEQFNNAETEFVYDGPFSLLTRADDPLDNSTEISYAANGNVSTITDAEGNVTAFFYEDPRFPDQPTRIVDAENQTTRLEYTAKGNVSAIIDPLARVTRFEYDGAGNNTRVIDAKGYATQYVYDSLNRPTSVTDPENHTTAFDYGDSGCGCSTPNLARVILPNGTSISYDYDGLSRRVSRTDQGGRTSFTAYDPEGTPTVVVGRTGERLRYASDSLGRISAVQNDVSGEIFSSFRYDILGNISEASNDISVVQMNYDSLGRLLSEQQSVFLPPAEPLLPGDLSAPRPPLTSMVSYQYDAANRLTRRIDELGVEVFRYDARGELIEINYSDQNFSSLLWVQSRDRIGRRSAISHPNGLTQNFTYDAASQLRAIETVGDAGQVFDILNYNNYSEASQSLSMLRSASDGTAIEWNYSYSTSGRLVSAERQGLATNASATNQSLTYGADGRLLSVDGQTVLHDAAGRLTELSTQSGLTRRFAWDLLGRLVGTEDRLADETVLSSTRSFFDALGRRIAYESNGILSIMTYSRWEELSVRGDGAEWVRTIHGSSIDDQWGQVANDGSATMLHRDRLGSVVAASALQGGGFVISDYSPYGQPLMDQELLAIPSTFTSLPWLRGSGVIDARSRVLLPEIGAYLSEDPVGIFSSTSLYQYVSGDPVNYVDPGGLLRVPVSGPLGPRGSGATLDFVLKLGAPIFARKLGIPYKVIGSGILGGIIYGLNPFSPLGEGSDCGKCGCQGPLFDFSEPSQPTFPVLPPPRIQDTLQPIPTGPEFRPLPSGIEFR